MIFRVSRGTLALALHDHVMPSLPSSRANASTFEMLSVSVSSSKKNSFTSGKLSRAQASSAATLATERVR